MAGIAIVTDTATMAGIETVSVNIVSAVARVVHIETTTEAEIETDESGSAHHHPSPTTLRSGNILAGMYHLGKQFPCYQVGCRC
jgi:hypothetical protein